MKKLIAALVFLSLLAAGLWGILNWKALLRCVTCEEVCRQK